MDAREKSFCEMCAFGLAGPAAALMAGYHPSEVADTAAALLASNEVREQIEREKKRNKAECAAICAEMQHMAEELKAECEMSHHKKSGEKV